MGSKTKNKYRTVIGINIKIMIKIRNKIKIRIRIKERVKIRIKGIVSRKWYLGWDGT